MWGRGERRGGRAGRRARTPAFEGLEGRICLSSAHQRPNAADVIVRLNIVGLGALSGTSTGADGTRQSANIASASQAASDFDTVYARARGDAPRWESEASLTNTYVPGRTSFTFGAGTSVLSGAHSGTLHMAAESGTVTAELAACPPRPSRDGGRLGAGGAGSGWAGGGCGGRMAV